MDGGMRVAKLRVAEFFSGIGAQAMALRNIGIDYEVVLTSDWDYNSVLAYNAIHTKEPKDFAAGTNVENIEKILHEINISSNGKEPMTAQQIKRMGEKKKRDILNAFANTKNMGSITRIKPESAPDFDLMTYSFPCQDISIAGKQKGLQEGSGTRSSLLWECAKLIEAKLPKFLLMENVKNLVGKKHKPDFDKWCEYLDGLGYTTCYQILNAKDYGVPQNRERVFAVSILGEHEPFEFPEPQPLTVRLKDILEDEVPENYYIDQERTEQLLYNNQGKIDLSKHVVGTCHKGNDTGVNSRDRVYSEELHSPALTATMYKDPPKITKVGNVNPSGKGMNGAVFSEEGLAPTVTTNKGEGSKILLVGNMYAKETNPEYNPQAGRVYDKDGISPALDTCSGGNRMPKVLEASPNE